VGAFARRGDGAARTRAHARVRGRRNDDQVGNRWKLDRTPGGSSGGSVERGREQGLSQFLDKKAIRPGLEAYRRRPS
jgi:hypothetical protein